jgi:hypothetical protein
MKEILGLYVKCAVSMILSRGSKAVSLGKEPQESQIKIDMDKRETTALL